MLCLKKMTYFNEFKKDTVDGRIIGPGEWYYEDMDTDTCTSNGLIISADHYMELKKAKLEEDWEHSRQQKWLNNMESERDYKEALREAERGLQEAQVLKLMELKEVM